MNAAFRKVIKGHFRLKDNQIASFLKQQADEKKQLLFEGKSVKRHISSGNNGFASTQSAPVETPLPETAIGTLIKALLKRGCPESRVMEYMEWEKQQQLTGNLTGVKLDVRLKMFLGTYEEPAAEPDPEVVEPEQPDTRRIDMTHLPYASGIRWVRQNKHRRWGYRIKQSEALAVLAMLMAVAISSSVAKALGAGNGNFNAGFFALVVLLAFSIGTAMHPQKWKLSGVFWMAVAITGWFAPYNPYNTGAGVYPLLHAFPLIFFIGFWLLCWAQSKRVAA